MKHTFESGVQALAPVLASRKLIILVGSGVSVPPPSNLPTWDQFLRKFVDFCRSVTQSVKLRPEDAFDDLLDDAEKATDKYPVRVASVLRNKLAEIDRKYEANINAQLKNWLLDLMYLNRNFNPNHKAIVRACPKSRARANMRFFELAGKIYVCQLPPRSRN